MVTVVTNKNFVMNPVGLGDTVFNTTHKLGLDKLAELYTKLSGRPCNCASRQEALNKLVPYKGVTDEHLG
jgi:hypothetical protein